MPPGAYNRVADNWRPIFAIAQIVGGDWPQLALEAYHHLAAPVAQASSPASPRGGGGPGARPRGGPRPGRGQGAAGLAGAVGGVRADALGGGGGRRRRVGR